MYKFTVALCILPILEKKYETSAMLAVKKPKRTTEEQDEIPFVVTGYGSIQPRPPWLTMFTASVIAQEWALTCAQCVETVDNPEIWYGKLTDAAFDAEQTSRVMEIHYHPAYRKFPELKGQERIIDNNLALLRVGLISLRVYGRLLSVDYMSLIGIPVTTVGAEGDADLMETAGNPQKKHILAGEGAITTCDKRVPGFNRYLICVTPKCSSKDQASSAGDSGAPLLYNNKIVGVQSYEFSDGYRITMSYTPVSPYLDWIAKIMINWNEA